MTTLDSLEHPLKVEPDEVPMAVTPEGMVMLVRLEQVRNALSPRRTTLVGRMTLDRLVQDWKA